MSVSMYTLVYLYMLKAWGHCFKVILINQITLQSFPDCKS